jgi:hypothetical protein
MKNFNFKKLFLATILFFGACFLASRIFLINVSANDNVNFNIDSVEYSYFSDSTNNSKVLITVNVTAFGQIENIEKIMVSGIRPTTSITYSNIENIILNPVEGSQKTKWIGTYHLSTAPYSRSWTFRIVSYFYYDENGTIQSVPYSVGNSIAKTIPANYSGLVYGVCGSANNGSFLEQPTTDLCSTGTVSNMNFDNGKWVWKCYGNGGMVACSANQETINITCGSANNQSFSELPTTDLCAPETTIVSTVVATETGWSWICTGSTGTAPINCSANKVSSTVAPACGSANGGSFTAAPTTDLCSSGTATNPITNTTGWSWICTGSTGTALINCSAKRTVSFVTPACGSANGGSFTAAPTTDLCSSGTATNPITNTTGWSWICTGSTGTALINCSAKRTVSFVTPACGSANGGSFTAAPTTDLCSSGTATNPITNTTGWSWICTGSTGTAPINCSAKRTVSSVTPACGSANGGSFTAAPTTDLCSSGTATNPITNTTGWSWICTGSTGTAPINCSAKRTVSSVTPACGLANGGSFTSAPTTDLCSSGTATEIITNDLGNWSWQCEDNNIKVECFANFKKESHPLNLKISADLISASNQLTNSASYKITASLDQDSTIRKIKIKAFSEGVSSVEANIDSFVFGSQGKAWSTILTLPKSASDRNWTIKIISYEYAGELGTVPLTYDYSEAESPKTTIVVPAIKVVSLSTECVIAEYEKDWSVCVNGEQTKKLITSPVGCNTNKEKVIKQSCSEKIECQYVYSDWSACTNEKKTRTIISKEPNNCNFGSPLLEESCVPEKIISSVEPKIVEEPAKTDLEITQKQPEVDSTCLQAGINNQADCQVYLYQKNITSECLANNLTTLEKCREYFLNKYGTPLKCTGLESAKCGSLINDVILSYFKTAPIAEETRKTLTEEAGKPATINAQTETLIINPLETEIDKQPVQIKIEDVPLSASNGDVSVALVATELKEEQKTLAPVAIVFDDNKNGVPDDIENRLGFVPENRQTVDSSKLTGIDKAIIDGQSIEQPKFNQTIAVSDVLKVAEIKNIELVDTDKNLNKNIRFEGTALPNQIITLYIYSVTPIILTVQADANGNWVYDLDKTLVNGTHEVYVAINDEKGKIIETSLPKPFFIEEALAVSMEEFSGIQDATSIPDQSKMILIFYALAGLICVLVFVSLFLLIKQRSGK